MNPGLAQDHLVGRSLGEFVLRERIGAGGFGAVYRATQATLDREAVVKVLHSRLNTSKAAAARFLREAKLASKLDHPYAAHIYAFGAEPDGELWIAMELVRGTPLDQILRIQGPLPLQRLVPLLDRICEVVHSAHEQGIVHRDLKPANVMVLARSGRLLPKLLDFGIAKAMSETAEPADEVRRADDPDELPDEAPLALEYAATVGQITLPTRQSLQDTERTQRGAILGSPLYMAPEQWDDPSRVGVRTDLYALGVLAYECLVGKPPFAGATTSAIAFEHASQAVPSLGAGFPSALDKVLDTVLAKNVEERYPDALAFAAAFRQAAGIVEETATVPSIEPRLRDAFVSSAPQPIAEAVAAVEAARNAYRARDVIAQAARTITRYLGLLTIACRSRISSGPEPVEVADTLRTLYRRSLTDPEWLQLGRVLTSWWVERRDAYPIPELVDALQDRRVTDALESLCALRERDAEGEEQLVALWGHALAQLAAVLELLGFVRDYALVVTTDSVVAERWMGVRRPHRTTVHVHCKGQPPSVPLIVDSEGIAVLSLEPLFQVAAPTPGSARELFLFDGRDARGARLVALPTAFEHHDDRAWDWLRAQLAGSLDEAAPEVAVETAPYRGLSAFSAEDAGQFFGREGLVDAFSNRLKVQPLLAVVGRSGCGKTSFVQAGLIPALPTGWRAITMRPGASPLGSLVARLEHAGVSAITRATIAADKDALGDHLRRDAERRGPMLLVIDQLEELFTLCEDADERRAFAAAIASAARDDSDPVRVIVTLRDDFLVRTEQEPELRNRISQGLQLLTVPRAEDLQRILVAPARRAGYELESGLAAEMVAEVGDQPGALALISFTAQKLWELRDRHFKQLTRSAYKTLGGVAGALARHADTTFDALPAEERALAREAFRHLVTTDATRAIVTREDLRQLLGGGQPSDRVIEKLVAARLLVASENEAGTETIEIVHEALLVTWPRLVEWRREDAEGARFREQLQSAAKQWDERGREKGLLWRGDPLVDYSRWRSRHEGPLTAIETGFTNASLAEAARVRRYRRAGLATAFATLAAVVAGLILFTTRLESKRRELHDTLERQYEEEGRRLVLDDDPLAALAYLAKAGELGANGRAHDFLIAEAIQASGGEVFEVHHDLPVAAVRFSGDGTRLATAAHDHRVRIWDARSGALLQTLDHDDAVILVSFAPGDGTILTQTLGHTAALWNAGTGRRVRELSTAGRVQCASFSPDGKLVVTGGNDGSVATWDAASGVPVAQLSAAGAPVLACAVSPDARLVASGDRDGIIRVWELDGGRLLHELSGPHREVSRLRFIPRSERLLASTQDGSSIAWDVPSGQVAFRLESVTASEPSPDGRYLVTLSSDRTAAVWDAKTGTRIHVLTGHAAAVTSAVFSPDGQYVVTTSDDSTARLWETASGRPLARWRGHQDAIHDAAFDPQGERVATASWDGTAIVWNVQPQVHVTWLVGHRDGITSANFVSDGQTIVTGSNDGTARLWDAVHGRELAVLRDEGSVFAAASPDGREVATANDRGTIRVWDVASATTRTTLRTNGAAISQVTWSPDGSLLAASSEDGTLRCWETATGRLRFEKRASYVLRSAAFSPRGDAIVTSGDDPIVRIWNLEGAVVESYVDLESNLHLSAELDPSGSRLLIAYGQHAAKIVRLGSFEEPIRLEGHVGFINYATWSPDGTMAITASLDGTARIWDTHTGALLEILEHPARVGFASFSPDNKRVVFGGYDGLVEVRALPQYGGTAAALATLLQCRLHHEVRGNGLVPRPRDTRACRGGS